MTDPQPYTCTVTPQEAPARRAQVQRLAQGLRSRQRHAREVRLRFDAHLAPLVAAFVRDEARCCGFFEFAITEDQQAVELRVRGPEGAEPLLASLFEVFGAPRSGGDKAPGR